MIICGVDIGKNGGSCLVNIDKKSMEIELLETENITNILNNIENTFVIMEKIFVSQKMNPQSPIAFGMNKQKAIQAINNCLYFEVHPRSWQKYYYSSLKREDKSKFKTLRQCYNETLGVLNVNLKGKENDGKRASVLIALYGTYYTLTDAIKNRKLSQKHYMFIDKHMEILIKIKNRIHRQLILKLEVK